MRLMTELGINFDGWAGWVYELWNLNYGMNSDWTPSKKHRREEKSNNCPMEKFRKYEMTFCPSYYFPDEKLRKKKDPWKVITVIALHFNRARDSILCFWWLLMLSNEFET